MIEQIVIHHSASEWGTAVEIDKWHRDRGWNRIGYMGVILNGYPIKDIYWEISDGTWEWGRPLNKNNVIESWEKEAHAFGINNKSVGICLIGNKDFSLHQMLAARHFILRLCKLWKLSFQQVIGHCEVQGARTKCPEFRMDVFRCFMVDYNLIDELVPSKE